ncbi:unnamed protein product [Protopolystoma xenopodis]|uniref:Uncharacterized protein n=1 Tax=Protopolystoma xenopodis TaxID=117903 RepID=A0A448WRX5_9PLAT|nr:unnamed protein product [Protopolystoma xenopodis]
MNGLAPTYLGIRCSTVELFAVIDAAPHVAVATATLSLNMAEMGRRKAFHASATTEDGPVAHQLSAALRVASIAEAAPTNTVDF